MDRTQVSQFIKSIVLKPCVSQTVSWGTAGSLEMLSEARKGSMAQTVWELFLKEFFWRGPFLKPLLNLLQHCFCFMHWSLGSEACGIPVPWPGIEPATSLTLEGEVPTTGPQGKSQFGSFCLYTLPESAQMLILNGPERSCVKRKFWTLLA